MGAQILGVVCWGLVLGFIAALWIAADLHRAGRLPVVRRPRWRDRAWHNNDDKETT